MGNIFQMKSPVLFTNIIRDQSKGSEMDELPQSPNSPTGSLAQSGLTSILLLVSFPTFMHLTFLT